MATMATMPPRGDLQLPIPNNFFDRRRRLARKVLMELAAEASYTLSNFLNGVRFGRGVKFRGRIVQLTTLLC